MARYPRKILSSTYTAPTNSTAVGVYTFTFTNSMPDGNYAINATAQTPGTNSDCAVNITNGTTPSSTGFSLTVARYGNGNEDTPILHVQVVR